MAHFTATVMGHTFKVVSVGDGFRVEQTNEKGQLVTSSTWLSYEDGTAEARATRLAMIWLQAWIDTDDHLTTKNL